MTAGLGAPGAGENFAGRAGRRPSRTTAIAAARRASRAIDYRLLTIGRREADSTAGRRGSVKPARFRAPDRVRLFRPCADVRDCSAKPAPQRRRTAALYGAPRRQPTTRIRLCMGCPMRSPPLRSAATLCLMLRRAGARGTATTAAEHLSVPNSCRPKSPHWVLYVYDERRFDNEIDARVHLFDGDSYRRLGQIDAGFLPSVSLLARWHDHRSGHDLFRARQPRCAHRRGRVSPTTRTLATTGADRAAVQARPDLSHYLQHGLQHRRPLPVRGLPDNPQARSACWIRRGARCFGEIRTPPGVCW